jgi:hypothetical protein|tara:strand:- start:185 stop:664 length:480 start_codon:yes stop_codon:yes gene_type:complete
VAAISPIPADTALALPTGVIVDAWYQYFLQARDRLNANPHILGTVFDSVTGQSAAIGTTSIPLPTLGTGLYRVSTYARITQAASTSSSLTVTLGWTDGTVACTQSGSAMTGNTTATTQSGSLMIRNDNLSPLTYSTAYASSGGTVMQYRLDIAVEQIPT